MPTLDQPEAREGAIDTTHPDQDVLLPSSSQENFASASQSFRLDTPDWYSTAAQFALDAPDVSMTDLASFSPVTLSSHTAKQPLIVDDNPEFAPSDQTTVFSLASGPIPMVLQPPFSTSWSDTTSSSASSIAAPPSPSTPSELVRVLSEYPSLLMRGSFHSPFLHFSLYPLYSKAVPDMTYLPWTATAICCGSGINFPDGNRFFRRAMDAARQRLVSTFVSIARFLKSPDQLLIILSAD
jgi:hypothetical protein